MNSETQDYLSDPQQRFPVQVKATSRPKLRRMPAYIGLRDSSMSVSLEESFSETSFSSDDETHSTESC